MVPCIISENEKELETLLSKLRSEKQKQIGECSSQSIVERKRHSVQNKKYKDYILPSSNRKQLKTKMQPKKKVHLLLRSNMITYRIFFYHNISVWQVFLNIYISILDERI